MGYSPQQVNGMSLWEFNAAFKGWKAANGIKPPGRDISDERLAELGIAGF